jgi:UDP-N-acetylmuramate--alanine ligase
MQKLRIGVLMGGKSLEKEVSFNTGRTVCDYIDTTQYNAVPLYQTDAKIYLLPWHFLHRGKTTDFEHRLAAEATCIAWDDLKKHVDFIYIAQHGRYAEDGTLQGFLNILGIPYLGSNVFASALRTDKIIHKTFLNNAGIATPKFIAVEPYEVDNFAQHKQSIFDKLTTLSVRPDPSIHFFEDKKTLRMNGEEYFVVKPYNEGSSIGISIVTKDNLEAALKKACYIEPGKKKRVLIEEKIIGMEFTCIILTDHTTGELFALPPTESVADEEIGFFDYEQKYMPGRGIKRTPARCSVEITERIQETCIQVMRTLEFDTMCRIDGFVTHDDKIVIIDPNTFSGMAPSSYIFNQAAEINMSPAQLINYIITTELHRYNLITTDMNNQISETSSQTHKIRVAILLGGKSNEKETSLDSGRNVFYKLSPHKYDPIAVFVSNTLELYILTQSQLVRNSTKEIIELLQPSQKIQWNDLPNIADFVFIGLHGGEGEDGSVQGTLEILGMPYNGSSVLASALCMNKYKANELLAAHGFDVPKNVLMTKHTWNTERAKNIIEKLGLPLIVKPHDDGCSVMVQKVTNNDELIAAIETILQEKDAVLIEECITGMELTVGVMGNEHPRALPPSQAISLSGILSIEEKFLPGAGENQTPAPLPQETLEFVQRTIERAFSTLQCKGYSRIDCFYQTAEQSPTKKERVIILENNTLPGLTPATCLFHQAAEIGLKPMDFLDQLITLGFAEHTAIHASLPVRPELVEGQKELN